MTISLPPLPAPELLADLCRETATAEGVEPQLVEKDFYLTRLIWALAQELGDQMLLKGGTLLSKVDLGFFRMSEDADFVLPGESSAFRKANVSGMDRVRAVVKAVSPMVGAIPEFPAGQLSHKAAHCEWKLDYVSNFGKQSIKLEVSIRPLVQAIRRVQLQQLVNDPLLGSYEDAYCFALSAEKVRAAFTRDAIRDFYDLERFLGAGADLSSPGFVKLVDFKLAELKASPLAKQAPRVAMNDRRRRLLDGTLGGELASVLRKGAPAFDLDRTLDSLDALWRPLRNQ
jgi:predicted nucleotidyltransferase component of viral defense system